MNDIFALAEGMELINGKYTIIRMLSHGGFGVTYLAHHNPLDIDVCIKEFFPKDYCNRDAFSYEVTVSTSGNVGTVENFMRKFIKEAKSIARQHHEGIIKILDIFEENGTAYYVMDYIDGQSLKQLVEARGPLPLDEALGYIRQAAEALGYLHGRNMTHLDVKPSNMMVDHSGKLTLIDFGLSKHYGDDGRETTMTPMCISRGYSPKEQYLTGGVSYFSPAADIYALGATLYYLLTGQNPPEAVDTPLKKLVFPASVPENVEAAIRHAMQYEPEDRTPSTAAFLAEIAGPAAAAPRSSAIEATPSQQSFNPIKEELYVPQYPINEKKSELKKKINMALGVGALIIVLIFAFFFAYYNNSHGDRGKIADTTMKEAYVDTYADETEAQSVSVNNEQVENTVEENVQAIAEPAVPIVNENIQSTTKQVAPVVEENVSPVQEKTYGHKIGHTGDLITMKGGEYICFTVSEWNEVPNKSAFSKLGVVVKDVSCPAFYVALYDIANGADMTWYDAVDKYGEMILPSEKQCSIMAKNCDRINNAMRSFGGSDMRKLHWGKEYNASRACLLNMVHGTHATWHKEHDIGRVRSVAPVPSCAR